MTEAATSAIGLGRIGQIAMNAHDIPRAVRFYRDALGIPLLFEVPPKMAFFNCGGVRLMLSLPEGAEYDHAGSVLYFKVDDIEAAHAAKVILVALQQIDQLHAARRR